MAKKDVKDILTGSWIDDHKQLSEDEALNELATCEFGVKNLEYNKDNDDQLSAAKEIVKDLGGGYNAAIKYERAKIDFLLDHIQNKRIANQ